MTLCRYKKSLLTLLIGVVLFGIGAILYWSPAQYPINVFLPTHVTQDAFAFLPQNHPIDQPLMSQQQQRQKTKQYLQRFFFAWSKHNLQTISYPLASNQAPFDRPIQAQLQSATTACKKHACYNINYDPIHTVPAAIVANMTLNTFPNVNCNHPNAACYGITIRNTPIRGLPTEQPLYANPQKPGEGYPFDYLSNGDLWLGTPVQIVQRSADKQWLYVKGQGLMGWVKRTSVAHVSAAFRHHLMMTTHFVTPIQQRTSLYFSKQQQTTQFYLGSIYPLIQRHHLTAQIAIPIAGKQGNAVMKIITVTHHEFLRWPLKTSPELFSIVINQMLNMPYSWGGLHLDSDCSGTLARIYAAFGIWLAPQSSLQGNYGGKKFPLNQAQRQTWLIDQQGDTPLIPYLTLITTGHSKNHISHVLMYLGTHLINGHAHVMVFQTAWGIPLTGRFHFKHNTIGRAIYGRSVITGLRQPDPLKTYFKSKNLEMESEWTVPTFNVTLLTMPP